MAAADHAVLMDRMYRHQRHIYDLTRKYYLLGRDPMLAGLQPPAGGHVLEIGCGTGRNLIAAARLYPHASFYGVDISTSMLDTAAQATERAGLREQVRLACADATDFEPGRVFGRERYERIYISYSVSMIPAWRKVLANAMTCLAPGGELHVVDFGDLDRLPGWFRSGLHAWLKLHHVTPRNDLFDFAADVALHANATLEARRLHRGYAWIAVLRKNPA